MKTLIIISALIITGCATTKNASTFASSEHTVSVKQSSEANQSWDSTITHVSIRDEYRDSITSNAISTNEVFTVVEEKYMDGIISERKIFESKRSNSTQNQTELHNHKLTLIDSTGVVKSEIVLKDALSSIDSTATIKTDCIDKQSRPASGGWAILVLLIITLIISIKLLT